MRNGVFCRFQSLVICQSLRPRHNRRSASISSPKLKFRLLRFYGSGMSIPKLEGFSFISPTRVTAPVRKTVRSVEASAWSQVRQILSCSCLATAMRGLLLNSKLKSECRARSRKRFRLGSKSKATATVYAVPSNNSNRLLLNISDNFVSLRHA